MHWQVLLPVLACLVVTGFLGVYLIWNFVSEDLKSQMQRRGELAAHALQNAVETAGSIGGIQRYVASLGAEQDFDLILVTTGNPATVIASTELALIHTPTEKLNIENLNDQLKTLMKTRQEFYAFHPDNDKYFEYFAPVLISHVIDNGKPLGRGGIVLRMHSDLLKNAIKRTVIIISSVFIALLIVLTAAITLLGKHYILLPQRRLMTTLTSRKLGKKCFAEVSGDNEFAEFSKALNSMLKEIDKVDQMKSEFVSTVSHELRTPLTSIQGGINLILGTQSDNIPEQTLELLEISKRNCARLSRLINDILDLEKIQSGRLEYEFSKQDLVRLTQHAIANNEGYGKQYNITLKFETTLDEALVIGDEFRLQQVFANLFSNAIKFSNEYGNVDISVHQSHAGFRVSVRNQGKEICKSFRNTIFTPFAQADSSDSREKGGAGLGLSISKAIIEHHSGKLDYLSENGETNFYFELPPIP